MPTSRYRIQPCGQRGIGPIANEVAPPFIAVQVGPPSRPSVSTPPVLRPLPQYRRDLTAEFLHLPPPGRQRIYPPRSPKIWYPPCNLARSGARLRGCVTLSRPLSHATVFGADAARMRGGCVTQTERNVTTVRFDTDRQSPAATLKSEPAQSLPGLRFGPGGRRSGSCSRRRARQRAGPPLSHLHFPERS